MNEKILEQISSKYKIALLTTFNYDLDYFDNQIFYKFFSNGIKDISVFVDSEQLQESLNQKKTNLGTRYSVIPFKMNKSFHPKLILLLDDNKAKLIIGSLNLTERGYSFNQEIFNSFEYDKDNQENLNLIIEAYNFFKSLNEISKEKDNEIFNKTINITYLKRTNIDGKIKFIDNLDKSIYDRTMEYIKGDIRSIDIAVPYYDNEAIALSFIEKQHPNACIKLYVQNEKSTFPQKLYSNYENKIFKFKKILCNDCSNFYHGKVFRFITDEHSYILYGSANCTNAALIKSYNDNGNVECDILEKGSIHDFDNFFLQFEEDYNEFVSYPIIDKNNYNKQNFILNSIIKEDYIKCIISYKEYVNKLQVYINNKINSEISFEYIDNNLIIVIPNTIVKEIGNVFQLKIINQEDKTESVINCFYNDYESISNYRNAEESNKNIAKKILFKNEIFINDVIDLIYQMPNNAADAKRIKETKKNYIEQQRETEESESDEEYIINEELLLEYKKKYDEDNLINQASHRIGKSYYNAIRDIIFFSDNTYFNNNNVKNISEKVTEPSFIKINVDVTDEELEIFNRRKGKRIIKKIINGILTDSYKEEVNYYDYKSYIGLINLFFDKYTDYRSESKIRLSEDNKKDYLFEYKDVSIYKLSLAKSLLDLLISTPNVDLEEEKTDILILCIQAILQEFYSIEEYGLEDKHYKRYASKLIEQLDDMFNIRDTYITYVKNTLKLTNRHKKIISEGIAIAEIESLFKYKSLERIKSIINYKEEHSLTQNINTMILEVKTNETIQFVNLKLELLRKELNKYFKEKYNKRDNIDSFIIVVEKANVNLDYFDPIIRFKLIWTENGFKKIKDTKLNNGIIEEIIEW